MNVQSSGRGQPYAEEIRQLYDVALRQRKQSPWQHQQQQSATESLAKYDDDEQSTTTTSTSTTTVPGGGLCCRCWSRHHQTNEDGVATPQADAGSRNIRRLRTAGYWSSSLGDYESVISCSDVTSPIDQCRPSVAVHTGALTDSPVLPDVVTLPRTDSQHHSSHTADLPSHSSTR